MTKEVLDIFEGSTYTPVIIEGYNGQAPHSGDMTVWPIGSTYPLPASPLDMTLSSNSALDKKSGGTGATVVSISGITTGNAAFSILVELNGRTEVKLPNPFYRILDFHVVEAGSLTYNAGNLYIGTGTVTAGVPANVYGVIQAKESSEKKAVYSVPLHTVFYLTSITLYPTATTDTVQWELAVYNEGHRVKTYKNITKSELTYKWEPDFPIEFTSNTDLIINTLRTSASEAADIPVRTKMEGVLKRR